MLNKKSGLKLRVGLTAIIAMLMLAITIITIEKLEIGKQGYPLEVAFNFVDGIQPQSDVVVGGGVKIGYVSEIIPRGRKIYLKLRINKDIQIPRDAQFQVMSKGVMGNKYLNVVIMSDSQDYLRSGEQIEGLESMSMDRAFKRFGQIADSLDSLLGDENIQKSLIEILPNLNKLIVSLDSTIRQNKPEIKQAVKNFSRASNNFYKISKVLDKNKKNISQILSEENADNFTKVMANLAETSEKLNIQIDKLEQEQGVLGVLINDEQVAADLKNLIKELKDHPWKLLWKK